ncbi:MAG: hybrid sensor histidine kinase/response regulator [Cyanobacteria bacterium P01_H01_bin.21]
MSNSSTVNILAVDDAADNLFLLESLLDEIDEYQVHLAENGEEALATIAKSPPDLILLDIMMPGLSGYDVAKWVRENPRLPYIPILLLTAHEKSSLVKGLDAGADDFLRKPFDVDELLARVRSMVRLKRSIDAHRHMVQQRDDFVARLTHDLRTPLVAANRVLDLCLKGTFGDIDDEAQTALANIITNNTNLLKMANTLLEVYRHDAGQKSLAVVNVSLKSLGDQVVTELAPLASQKGLKLTLEVANDYIVRGDQLELRRLLTNLVGNAIKFTDTGHITVRLHSPEDEPEDETVCLDVEDTGPGISKEDQRQIFEWFRQGDHMRAGSGLGLHLSQRIAQLHNGKITLKSEPGKGSTFSLKLPLLKESQ